MPHSLGILELRMTPTCFLPASLLSRFRNSYDVWSTCNPVAVAGVRQTQSKSKVYCWQMSREQTMRKAWYQTGAGARRHEEGGRGSALWGQAALYWWRLWRRCIWGLLGSWEVRKAWLSRSQPAHVVLETSVRTGFCVASYSLWNGNLLWSLSLEMFS